MLIFVNSLTADKKRGPMNEWQSCRKGFKDPMRDCSLNTEEWKYKGGGVSAPGMFFIPSRCGKPSVTSMSNTTRRKQFLLALLVALSSMLYWRAF